MMHATIDTTAAEAAPPHDGTTLRSLAAGLLAGQPLLFARPSYPEEIKLHFGTIVDMPRFRGRTLQRGSIVLSPVASSVEYAIPALGRTFVFRADGSPGDPEAFAAIDGHIRAAGGPTVTAVDVSAGPLGYSLAVGFSDGATFTIRPNPDPPGFSHGDDPVPDWELLAPPGRCLRVGPGLVWDYPDPE